MESGHDGAGEPPQPQDEVSSLTSESPNPQQSQQPVQNPADADAATTAADTVDGTIDTSSQPPAPASTIASHDYEPSVPDATAPTGWRP
ncbi:hypothetical protein NPX13_g5822 [Xylaria arbuscula]|uniref:Uncharacterized protein n=1 Tax=Xylaria arbuscula TaxID=114810 RepID=A0A9W8NDR5_9PEZI|nr:hypothetical protein NPX13_g5822 [Xylaria arbuscula]